MLNVKSLVDIGWTHVLAMRCIDNYLVVIEHLRTREGELLIWTQLNSNLVGIFHISTRHLLYLKIIRRHVLFPPGLVPWIRKASFLLFSSSIDVIVFQKVIHQSHSCWLLFCKECCFVYIWILVLSYLRDVMIEPLFGVFIEVLWKFLEISGINGLITVWRIRVLVAITSTTVSHNSSVCRFAWIVTCWTFRVCGLWILILLEHALSSC